MKENAIFGGCEKEYVLNHLGNSDTLKVYMSTNPCDKVKLNRHRQKVWILEKLTFGYLSTQGPNAGDQGDESARRART